MGEKWIKTIFFDNSLKDARTEKCFCKDSKMVKVLLWSVAKDYQFLCPKICRLVCSNIPRVYDNAKMRNRHVFGYYSKMLHYTWNYYNSFCTSYLEWQWEKDACFSFKFLLQQCYSNSGSLWRHWSSWNDFRVCALQKSPPLPNMKKQFSLRLERQDAASNTLIHFSKLFKSDQPKAKW